MSERFDLSDPAQYAAGIEAAKEAHQQGRADRAAHRHGLRRRSRRLHAVGGRPPAGGQGPRPGHAAARAGRHGPGRHRPGRRLRAVRPGPDRRVLARRPDPGRPVHPDAGLGPGRDPRHGRGPHAAARRRPRSAQEDRADGREQCQLDRQPGRDDRRRSRRTARRLHRGLPGRRPLRRGRRVHDHRPDRLGAPPAPRRRHRHGPPPRGRHPGHRRGSHPARRRRRP